MRNRPVGKPTQVFRALLRRATPSEKPVLLAKQRQQAAQMYHKGLTERK